MLLKIMQQETKTYSNNSMSENCQNCKKDFTIEPEDFNFYEKIKVPPPTFCPRCRFVRRLASTNERILYKRKCDFSGEDIFSMYPVGTDFPVYKTDIWYSDAWDPHQYGVDYDFSRPFFEQLLDLYKKVPRMALVKQGFSINSDYTHRVHDMKNSYMVFRSTKSANTLYSYIVEGATDCSDCIFISKCELCYECVNCSGCYSTRFSQESSTCRDSSFLYACRNCSSCVGCVNLVNQEYCIFNEKYTREKYFEKLQELKLNTTSGIEKMEKEFSEFRKKFPVRAITSVKSDGVSGNWFSNSKNVHQSFDCWNVKDCKYVFGFFDSQDSMDVFEWGNQSELLYESQNCGINCSRIYFCNQCWMGAHDLFYCNSCPSSSNCFGCIGLKKGEYSILNKKYSKEEYETLKEKIIKQMKEMPYTDVTGLEYRFGENFPVALLDFAYNETAAIDFFPIDKKEALALGYKWRDKEKKNYNTTMKSLDLPETIAEVDDSILSQIIECGDKNKEYSVGAYRITENELAFYRRMDLPIPRVCFDVRHTRRLQKRPPLKIIKRNCTKCEIEVETVYDENYAPILYCEKCYQQEVY